MFQPTYDIPLAYGGNTVWLRPSLLAGMRLEALHSGFPALLIKIQETDTATLRSIITYSATDKQAAQTLIAAMADKPLQSIQQATLGPALALVAALIMPSDSADNTNSKPIEWSELYADLFKMATGWLHWTPETAYNATLPEILHAFEGHTDQLKAIHGGADDVDDTSNSQVQRQANIDAGLDPEFDRDGLASLREMGSVI